MPRLNDFRTLKDVVRYLKKMRYVVDEYRRLWNYPVNDFSVSAQHYVQRSTNQPGYDREKLDYAVRLFEHVHFAVYARWLRPKDLFTRYQYGCPETMLEELSKLGYKVDQENKHLRYPTVRTREQPYRPRTKHETQMVLNLLRYYNFWIEQHVVPVTSPTSRVQPAFIEPASGSVQPRLCNRRGDVIRPSRARARAVYVQPNSGSG